MNLENNDTAARPHRAALLLPAAALVAAVWLVVLPRLGSLPGLRGRIDSRKAAGINAGAMFYTELEVMGEVTDRIGRRGVAAAPAFWRPSRDRGGGPPE